MSQPHQKKSRKQIHFLKILWWKKSTGKMMTCWSKSSKKLRKKMQHSHLWHQLSLSHKILQVLGKLWFQKQSPLLQLHLHHPFPVWWQSKTMWQTLEVPSSQWCIFQTQMSQSTITSTSEKNSNIEHLSVIFWSTAVINFQGFCAKRTQKWTYFDNFALHWTWEFICSFEKKTHLFVGYVYCENKLFFKIQFIVEKSTSWWSVW